MKAAWKAYAHGSEVEHFADFCAKYLIQSVDEWDGKPLVLEPWQKRMLGEAMAYDEKGWPVWRSIVIIAPRKNGKTATLAAYAVYRLLTSDGSPEILLAASSDRQAGRLFEACATFIRKNETLKSLARVRDWAGEIVREDGGGKIIRLSSDPARLHGYNPSMVICDELAQWTTPSLKRAYAALTTGGGARKAPQVFTITTAGEAQDRETSILGRLIDTAMQKGKVEREPGLAVARMKTAQTLVWNHEAPTSDPNDIDAMKLANPASWITKTYLRRQAENPELTDPEVLQLHGCVWAAGVNAWIPKASWDACLEPDLVIEEKAPVFIGIDVALVHDSTALVLASPLEDGRVALEAKIWTAVEGQIGEFVPGGTIDLEQIEDYLLGLKKVYSVRETVYDPRFFERSAQILGKKGLRIAPLHQNSAQMGDAYQGFYDAVMEGRVVHSGEHGLTAHVMATAAQKTDRGWKVSKIRQNQRIDALVAAVMAHSRAVHARTSPYKERDLVVL